MGCSFPRLEQHKWEPQRDEHRRNDPALTKPVERKRWRSTSVTRSRKPMPEFMRRRRRRGERRTEAQASPQLAAMRSLSRWRPLAMPPIPFRICLSVKPFKKRPNRLGV